MERLINDKIKSYIVEFKENILLHLQDIPQNKALECYIENYDELKIVKEDYVKPRIKKTILNINRCCAKISNHSKTNLNVNKQCTRNKLLNCNYCGTHTINRPLGSVLDDISTEIHKVEVAYHEIKGIIYYIDENLNVYCTEDIMQDVENPKIIAKAIFNNGEYHIPEFHI